MATPANLFRWGSRVQRKAEAIKRGKAELLEAIGIRTDDPDRQILRAGLKPFMERMTSEEWQQRRTTLLDHLRDRTHHPLLSAAQPIRVREYLACWATWM